ncbi:RHS repeat domain-containing protein [Pseudomonas mosselii]|uniref:RHS repeat domain-containing protein n=1 Tax=Pseudomonas mosselii TaxID=78327 RepID=UPI0012FDDF78|nr:hypothetical protein [Pseudomonas mosselii]
MTTTTAYEYKVEEGQAFLLKRLPAKDGKDRKQMYRVGPLLSTIQNVTGHDHKDGKPEESRRKTITQKHSQFSGEQVLAVDDNDVKILSQYNELGQVVAEIVAPEDEDGFEAERTYSYMLCPNNGSWDTPADERAWQTRTDVNGVTTRTDVDGRGLVLAEWREDWDNNGGTKPEEFRQLYSARYDVLGQLREETEHDWRPGKPDLLLKTGYEIDGWWQQSVTINPDGSRTVEQNDPVGPGPRVHDGRVTKSWREWTGASPKKTGEVETRLNKADAPVWVERRDLDEKQVSLQTTRYDGLARNALQTTGEGAMARITGLAYDWLNRPTHETRPKAISYSDDPTALTTSVVERQYAPHTREDLQTRIDVTEVVDRQRKTEARVLGSRKIDGLGRLESEDIGGRERTLHYKPGERQPERVITPEGQIDYTYELRLSEKPMSRGLGAGILQANVSYDYDKINARLKGWDLPAQDGRPRQTLEREYFQTGQIKSETFTTYEGTTPVLAHKMAYVYSHRGRLLEYTDVQGQVQVNDYDAHGRLTLTTLHAPAPDPEKPEERGAVLLETTFSYDNLGRQDGFITTDNVTGEYLETKLVFDEFDREVRRTFIGKDFAQTLVQAYDDVDAMISRVLRQGVDDQGDVIRTETYAYDLRQRLIEYTCSGDDTAYWPQDPYGNYISGQSFKFDGLDNIREVITKFVGGENTATYLFENADPVQLSGVENTHASYPESIVLSYDGNGNMISDEAQPPRTLKYDHLNRLLSVKGEEGEVDYYYTPLDYLFATEQSGKQELRFYREDELVNVGDTTLVKQKGQPLAELTSQSDAQAS